MTCLGTSAFSMAAKFATQELAVTNRRMPRAGSWVIVGMAALALAVPAWLRSGPSWADDTLFAEDTRAETFRTMDQVFPYRTVAGADSVWAFGRDPRPLPVRYIHEGQERDLSAFLERTVTTGLLVVHGGDIVHEEYRMGATENSRFTSWSMAKSVLSALIGIAIEDGHIGGVHDPIVRYVPAVTDSGYEDVSIEDALTMSSGVAFDENYADPDSDINRLFVDFAMGTPVEQIIARLDSAHEPGRFNNYVSSDSMVLGLVLESATGMPLSAYLEARLWGAMGAEADAFWNMDATGRDLALCCLNATLRDYARFGRLYLEDGRRDDVQIIPADWVAASVNPTAAHLQPGDNPASFWTFGYGYKWWIPEDPQGDFLAIGIWGQYLYLDPVHDVIIVKTSADPLFDDRDHESVAAFRAIARAVAGE